MQYLAVAFQNSKLKLNVILPAIVAILLCIYGAEVSQFLILTDTFVDVLNIDKSFAILLLLSLVLLSVLGGVQRLANICSALMPPFMISYIIIGLWVIIDHYQAIPAAFSLIFSSFFDFKSIVGGVGSQFLLAAHYGVSRAVYSGDIGIGYDSTVQSETKTQFPEKQARVAIFALFSDTLICTISIFIVLLTGVWQQTLKPSEYIKVALSSYIPYVDFYIAFLFFIAGFTTIIGYLVVGQKAATYLHPRIGKILYLIYAVFAFIIFSFCNQEDVILIMSVSGGILPIINVIGVFKLRKEIKFVL
jgi:AGCS family alanine or glycine:cation symporter